MSLFGSLLGDFEDDPFFRSHMQSMQRMNSMMNSMFADPFGMMGAPAIMDSHHPQNRMAQMAGMQMIPFSILPMPSLSMGRMYSDMENMSQNPNCHSFTSSSIMTMTSSPDGRPQVYQESMSTRTAPGGVKETKKTVSDSRTGIRKMAIGHHIGERAHILEREQNVHSGDREERQEFINLEEEEAETFNHEWESRTKRSMGAIGAPNGGNNPYSRGQQENRHLALPSTVPASSHQSKLSSRAVASPRRTIRSAHTSRPSNKVTTSRSAESTSTSTNASSNPIGATPAASSASLQPSVPSPYASPTSGIGRKRRSEPDYDDDDDDDDDDKCQNKRRPTTLMQHQSERRPRDGHPPEVVLE